MNERLAFFDLETYSLADLRVVGGRAYAEDESTRIMSLVVWIDGTYHLWTPTQCGKVHWPFGLDEEDWDHHTGYTMPGPICEAVRRGDTFVAHNCDEFDKLVWQACLDPVPTSWLDTLPLARCGGYPGALDKLSKKFLGIGKDTSATNILMKNCKTNRPPPPGSLAVIASYNIADVVALRAIYEKVKDFGDSVYPTHLAINQRGVRFDVQLAQRIMDLSARHVDRAAKEIETITGGEIKPGDLTRRDFILKWVQRQGVRLNDLRRDTVQLLLDDPEAFFDEVMSSEGEDEDE